MSHDRELFAGTAQYYARYRPPYPAELFDSLVAEFGLDDRRTVLDLGCGTGQLALPLSSIGGTVWAVDPDADMIAEGVRAQQAAAVGNIRWILGQGEDIPRMGLPAVRLCTMGASFHWMDRDLVLKALEEIIEPDGGIALASGSASIFSVTGAVQGAWLEVTRGVVTEFLGPERRAGRGTYSHPKRTHEDVLLSSAFRQVQSRRFTSTRLLTIEEIIGQQLSTSYASPMQLGERLPAFREELTRRLRELNSGDGFRTVEHTDLITARR
jgi:ubiquinone/menaquinone biosynthesis C-methylase UbiE